MEDLQAAIQSVLSDPAQMAQLQAMAQALGMQSAQDAASAPPTEAPEAPDGQVLALMGRLSQMHGSEERVFSALKPSLSEQGQRKADRALRAARLARLAGLLLNGGSHV